ncbi:MAG: IS5 family transposase [Chlamydiae bacterium]|nr:IS5 family transposase [Chlamydiota bacterium]
MRQTGLFDLSNRYEQLSQAGDPLEPLNAVIEWKIFLPPIERAFQRQRKSAAGRKPYDRLLMFKLLLLQHLYGLSDYQVEFQVRDRLSFMRFLGLSVGAKVPDEKTLWSFREVLVNGKVITKLFNLFRLQLEKKGFAAKTGSMVDACIVEAPRQRNTREENQQIKAGQQPETWKNKSVHVLRQKDTDARWTKKRNENYYGYKNHINADAEYKIKRVWGDSAYRSEAAEAMLKKRGYSSRVHYKPKKGGWIQSAEKRQNHRYSKIRVRVEHVFGFIGNTMKGAFVRTIGLARATFKIGMNNLVYNLCRYRYLQANCA